jgi:hypothetical protein
MMATRLRDTRRERVAPGSTGWAIHTPTRWPDPVGVALVTIDLLLFLGGMITHSGFAISFGVGAWVEPVVGPAAIVEGIGAVGLACAFATIASHAAWADRLTWWVLWYCFAGVLWGMARLAMGSIPEARTMTNDFLHIGMTLVTTVALVRLASRRT